MFLKRPFRTEVHHCIIHENEKWSGILKRTYKHLEQIERDLIETLRSGGHSFSEIGEIIDRDRSTVSREYSRNFGKDMYLPSEAHAKSVKRKSDAGRRISKVLPYKEQIHFLLFIGWAPAQIASNLRSIRGFSVCYETIYNYIYKNQMSWAKLLPRKHEPRWLKGMGRLLPKRDMIPNRTCISERPEWVNEKWEFGHWEGDSIVCSQSLVALNVMVERQTQYVSIRRVENHGPEATNQAMANSLSRFKKFSRRSITLDNGIEFKYHEKLKSELKMDTYFCHPYHSWEKGLVEQINGLIRRFLPKKTDLSEIAEKDIALIEYLLNSRPRELLNWQTPAEAFAKKSRIKLVDGALAA